MKNINKLQWYGNEQLWTILVYIFVSNVFLRHWHKYMHITGKNNLFPYIWPDVGVIGWGLTNHYLPCIQLYACIYNVEVTEILLNKKVNSSFWKPSHMMQFWPLTLYLWPWPLTFIVVDSVNMAFKLSVKKFRHVRIDVIQFLKCFLEWCCARCIQQMCCTDSLRWSL